MDSVPSYNLSLQDFISSILPQSFALPYGFMSYVQEKQNSKIYEKLTKTCKYFFYSKGFVVVVDMYAPLHNCIEKFGNMNITRLPKNWQSQRQKLWVNDSIFVGSTGHISNFYPLNFLTEKVYRFDNINLVFTWRSLKYEELKILSENGTFEDISFSFCQIVYQNGTEVLLEDIFTLFPNVKRFSICNDKLRCSWKTAKTLAILSKLEELSLWEIPEVFNIDDFIIFIKTRETRRYFIHFNSDASATYAYVTAFKNAVSSMCTSWNSDSKPPTLNFYESEIDNCIDSCSIDFNPDS